MKHEPECPTALRLFINFSIYIPPILTAAT
jgi:hypothetical protein